MKNLEITVSSISNIASLKPPRIPPALPTEGDHFQQN
jgi:hypothetical protein